MIKINKEYQNTLLKYFKKDIYDTKKILENPKYNLIHSDIKIFLESLDFEKDGCVSNDLYLSSHENNSLMIEKFFEDLQSRLISNAEDIFLKTTGEYNCDFTSNDKEEQVRCIKVFLQNKYDNLYNNFRKTHGKRLLEFSELHICPYCYRSYINIIESENKSLTPDLDHFYPKSRYPFLAVTLSNLVPSCLVCNERAKGSTDFYKNSVYPPSKIFDRIEFDYDVYLNKIFIKNYAKLIKDGRYKTLLDTFLIQETYATHIEVLKGIINKYRKYTNSKIEDISKYTVGLSISSIRSTVFYEYEFLNKKTELLYKLKKDLYSKIVLKKEIL